jgi:hypothetical protein
MAIEPSLTNLIIFIEDTRSYTCAFELVRGGQSRESSPDDHGLLDCVIGFHDTTSHGRAE